MNNTIINEMFESEELEEMRFNYNIRDMLVNEELEKELKTIPQEEQKQNANLVDEMLFSDDFDYDEIIEELEKEIKSVPQEEQKQNPNLVGDLLFSGEFDYDDIIEELEKELKSVPQNIYDGYNKLNYQGQEYYVKKRNYEFPICVMNINLVQVGIISEHDMNAIKMI
jgi:tetratricopeptide (TPR) repeat protein